MVENISPIAKQGLEMATAEFVYRWSFIHPVTKKVIRPKPFRIPVKARVL
jgi:hypothetical protein